MGAKEHSPLVLFKPMHGIEFHLYKVHKQVKIIVDGFGEEGLIRKGNKGMSWGDGNFLYTEKLYKPFWLGPKEILLQNQI